MQYTNKNSGYINSADNGRLGWYAIAACLPMSFLTIGEIRPYELAVLFALLSVFVAKSPGGFQRLTGIDALVLIYGLFQILVVFVGSDSFYDSARNYRYLVFVPLLTYAAVRMLPFSIRVVKRAHLILAIVLMLQAVVVIATAWQYGRRPVGMDNDFIGSLVKYSVLSAYVFSFLLFSWKGEINGFLRLLTQILMVIIGLGLILSASRGVTLPTVLLLFVVTSLRNSVIKRRQLLYVVTGGLIFLILLIAFSPPKFDYDESEILEDKSSLERIVSVDGYLKDITGRVQFWAAMFDIAMEKPVLGHGAAVFSLRNSSTLQNTTHLPSHSHNLLVSSVLAGGLLGLVIMLTVVFSLFNLLTQLDGRSIHGVAIEKALIIWAVVLLIVALTQDLKGGVATYLFFMLALLQQIVLHQASPEYLEQTNSDNETVDLELPRQKISTKDHSILQRPGNAGDVLLKRKSKE